MNIVDAMIERMKKNEGFRSHPYRDTEGKLSIGYGRNLDDHGISKEEGEILFLNDLSAAVDEAAKFPWVKGLSEVRKSVIVEMVFNMGPAELSGFPKMIAAIEKGDWEGASREMRDSHWHSQVGARAVELAEIMRSGLPS